MKKVILESNIHDYFGLYRYVRGKYRYTSILESLGDYHDDKCRFCILGVLHEKILYGSNDLFWVKDCNGNVNRTFDWVEEFSSWVNINNSEKFEDVSIMQRGTLGYIGYTEKNRFEKLKVSITQDVFIPSVFLVKYSLLFFYDRANNKGHWVFNSDLICENEIREFEKKFFVEGVGGSFDYTHFAVTTPAKADFDVNNYLDTIQRTIDFIKEGDIFQANITQRFSAKYEGNPFELYETLRSITPNPFFAYFDFDYPLISTSPERYIKIMGNKISTNPIKGTVRCFEGGEDQREKLQNCEKNHAENVMIVDLMRNDIGRVCVQGSVQVTTLCEIFKFNLLYHLESVVEGCLKDGTTLADILKATFPGGSITGAPKVRAMEIIEELETVQRGVYTGAIGFFGDEGYVDTSIAIRIIYFDDKMLYFHAGGGIVVDSNPENEYNELLLKVEGIKNALRKFEKI